MHLSEVKTLLDALPSGVLKVCGETMSSGASQPRGGMCVCRTVSRILRLSPTIPAATWSVQTLQKQGQMGLSSKLWNSLSRRGCEV